jgi:hypothetical protein
MYRDAYRYGAIRIDSYTYIHTFRFIICAFRDIYSYKDIEIKR